MYKRYKPKRQVRNGFWEWLEVRNERIMSKNGIEKFKAMLQDRSTNGIACARIYNELYENALQSITAMKKTKGTITTLFNSKKMASTIALLLASKLVEQIDDDGVNPIKLSLIVNNDYSNTDDVGLMQLLNLHNFVGEVIQSEKENFYSASLHYSEDHNSYINSELTKEERYQLHMKLVNAVTEEKRQEYNDYVYKFLYNLNTLLEKNGIVNKSNINNHVSSFSVSDLNIQYYRIMVDSISKSMDGNKEELLTYIKMMLCKLEHTLKNDNIPKVFEAVKYNPRDYVTGLTSLLSTYSEFSMLVDGFYYKDRWMVGEVQTWLDSIINETLTITNKNKRTKTNYVDVDFVDNIKIVKLSDYAKQYFDMDKIEQHNSIPACNFAMCVKPTDWELVDRKRVIPKRQGLPESKHELNKGGYLTPEAYKPLIPRLKHEYEPPSQDYLNGINKAQSTAFNINMRMLNRIEQLGYQYSPDAKLDMFKTYKRKPKQWTMERWKRYKTSNDSKNFQSNEIIRYAKMYSKWDEVYFPMYADNRGRGYYVPPYLSPQTTDLGKALLVFATTRAPLTVKDKDKYKILISGLCGYDKKSIKNRYKWFDKHEAVIISLGNDVLNSDTMEFFCNSDNPWQTLAACYDYVDFLNDIRNNGEHWSFIYAGKDGKLC